MKNIKTKSRKHKPRDRTYDHLVGKIGWCDGETLGLSMGHYVFIRKAKNGKCDVNTLTSITNNNNFYEIGKIRLIEKGLIYPIPKQDDTLPRFGGVDKRVIKGINVSDIKNIGSHSVKKRHHYYIKKYLK